MLLQPQQRLAAGRAFGARQPSRTALLRPLRAKESEDSSAVQSTLSALDSLLPPEPVKETPAAASTSSSSSSPAAASPVAASPSSNAWPALPKASSSSSPPSAVQRKAQANLEQVMSFDGLAPEVINGRAAMLGFFAALAGERHGDSLFSQVAAGGLGPAALVILAVTLASFAPALRQVPFERIFGKDKTPATFGPFTPAAEIRNGRAAMLGLLALMLIEGASSQPFFL